VIRPPTHLWFYVVYVSDRIRVLCETGRGHLGESGEYHMGRSESGSFDIWSFDGGSPHLCRLRTDHLALVSKFDYVLAYMGHMESHKLSSFYGR
jgi:hypothetical protein